MLSKRNLKISHSTWKTYLLGGNKLINLRSLKWLLNNYLNLLHHKSRRTKLPTKQIRIKMDLTKLTLLWRSLCFKPTWCPLPTRPPTRSQDIISQALNPQVNSNCYLLKTTNRNCATIMSEDTSKATMEELLLIDLQPWVINLSRTVMVTNRELLATLNRSITAWRAALHWLTTRTKTSTERLANKETRLSRLTTTYYVVPSKPKTATWLPKASKTHSKFPKAILDKFSNNPKWFCNNKSQ